MTAPSGSPLRPEPAVAADAAAVTEVVAALESALYGQTTFSQADLEEEWSEIDLERHARVVRDGDRIVGYGLVREPGDPWRAEGYVHPDASGRGIGRLLATGLEADAARHGARRIQNSVLEVDAAARRLLESLGYEPVRVFRELRIELAAPPPAPVWPDGLRVVPFDVERDAAAFHAAHQEAFADHWDYTPRDFESWSNSHLRGERFDPALWCVVRAGDEIAAGTICTGDTYGGGWVHALFTRRPWRRLGVGEALLGDAFGRLWEQGERQVGLGVDAASETGAFRLYERAGMAPLLGWVTFEKQLPGDLPSGTVTFLFSDVEGSTRLLQRLRGRYAEVLGAHRRLLRAAFERHGGRVVDAEGDGFFVAFARANDAIAAALVAQRSLASERWPEGVDVRVRMGVHTGEAELHLDRYVGLDVHRAARIGAAGHGGQVLVSSSTRELVGDELPAGVALRDLGEHRLKDLDHPERLFQLVAGDLPADFPPLATRAASGLPPAPNRTIGRDDDVRAIADRLRAGGVRLLTLTGPGGVGKTRLGVEAARAAEADFPDGAHLVSLAAWRRPEDVPAAVVKTLAIVVLSGESDDRAAERFLAAKRLLLVVDNVEHVLAAAPFVGRLLGACPGLTILATSREPLSLQAEERHPVPPLAADAAVALFGARTRARDPDFELGDADAAAVAEICRRVDGLPLAIELAAARCGLLSPGEIARRLHDALGATGSGARDAPARQQTLRATIDWSHDLLADAEQQSFARLAVFAGGATVEAAETVAQTGLDTLDGLVAKSLLVLRRDAGGPSRVGMLETIRAYAGERLAAISDEQAVRERHARYYLRLAERHGTEQALWGADGRQQLATLDAEIDNLHAALSWAIGRADAELALAIAAALGCYWFTRDRYAEAIEWIDRVLSLAGADIDPVVRLRMLVTKAKCLWPVGRAAERRPIVAALEDTARRLGDPTILSEVLRLRVSEEMRAERLDVADGFADEALRWARVAGDEWGIAEAVRGKAITASTVANLRERVDTAASLLSDVGNFYQLAYLLTDASYAALCLGGDRDATDFAARAAVVGRVLDTRSMRMINSGNRGMAALLTGQAATAAEAFREELALCRDMVILPHAFEGLRGLAAVAVVDGDDGRAATLFGAAEAHRYDQAEDPVEARLEAMFFAAARRRVGIDAWDAAARAGSRLGFEDAIACALEDAPASR